MLSEELCDSVEPLLYRLSINSSMPCLVYLAYLGASVVRVTLREKIKPSLLNKVPPRWRGRVSFLPVTLLSVFLSRVNNERSGRVISNRRQMGDSSGQGLA